MENKPTDRIGDTDDRFIYECAFPNCYETVRIAKGFEKIEHKCRSCGGITQFELIKVK